MINTPTDPFNQSTSTPVSPGSAYEMKPRSLSELITLSLQLFGKHIGVFMGIALLVIGPAALISLLGSAFSSQTTQSFQQTSSSTTVRSASQGISNLILSCTGLISLIIAIFVPWMRGAISYATLEHLLGRAPSARDAFSATRPKFASLWGADTLTNLALYAPTIILACIGGAIIGFTGAVLFGNATESSDAGAIFGIGFLCLVPLLIIYLVYALWIGVSWRFRAPIIVAEGSDGTQALRRSNQLVKGMRGVLTGQMAAVWVIEAILVGIPIATSSVLNIASGQMQNGTLVFIGALVFMLIGLAIQLVVTPIHNIFVAVLYLDTRIRKENLFATPVRTDVRTPMLTPAPATAAPILIAPPAPAGYLPPGTPSMGSPSTPPANPISPANPLPSNTPAQKIGELFNRIRVEGPNAELLNELGLAYMAVGDLGGALDALTRAHDLDPKDADIAYNLMLLHRTRKDTDSARRLMAKYLELETNPADAERVRSDPRFRDLVWNQELEQN